MSLSIPLSSSLPPSSSHTVPPTPTLAHYNRTVSLGLSVTLNCSVQAQPSPTYTWFHYDKQTRRESPIIDSRYTKLQNGSLQISNFQLSDFTHRGDCIMLLLCSAENAFGASKQYYTITLNENECVISTDTPPNSPSTQPTTTSTPSSETRSSDSHTTDVLQETAPTRLSELSLISWVSTVEGCALSGVPLYSFQSSHDCRGWSL